MSRETSSLIALALGCTFAAALFGVGTNMLSFKSVYEESGRELLILISRVLVYIVLAIILVFKGGWRGVAAALFMAVAATAIEWALLPFAYSLAALSDPAGYAERFGEVNRPSYAMWAAFDVIGIGIVAAVAQGLRIILAHFGPAVHQDE